MHRDMPVSVMPSAKHDLLQLSKRPPMRQLIQLNIFLSSLKKEPAVNKFRLVMMELNRFVKVKVQMGSAI
jgi:hypothetical protein